MRSKKGCDHICGSAEMRAYATCRQFGIFGRVGVQDVSMLSLRDVKAVQDAEAHSKISLHPEAQIVRKLHEVRSFAGPKEGIVKFAIEIEPADRISLILPGLVDRAGPFQVFFGAVGDGMACDQLFEQNPEFVQLADFIGGELTYLCPLAPLYPHEAFILQMPKGFTNNYFADTVALGQRLLTEVFTFGKLSVENGLPELVGNHFVDRFEGCLHARKPFDEERHLPRLCVVGSRTCRRSVAVKAKR